MTEETTSVLGALAFIGIDKRVRFALLGGYATVKRLHVYVYSRIRAASIRICAM